MSNEPVIYREKFSCVVVHLLHVASRSPVATMDYARNLSKGKAWVLKRRLYLWRGGDISGGAGVY